MIIAQSARRDLDEHVASLLPLVEPQTSQEEGLFQLSSQLKIPTEGEEMLLTEINHKQQCLKNKYITPKLSHQCCALWLFKAEKDFNISYLLTTPGFKSFLQL